MAKDKLLYYRERFKPEKKTEGAVGYDLKVDIHGEKERSIVPNSLPCVVGTGVYVAIPKGYYGMITLRSSLGAKGLCIPNSPGIIDSDYRGELKIILSNTTGEPIRVMDGERIAQLIICKCQDNLRLEELGDYNNFMELAGTTERGDGGLGSTGRN